MTQDTSNQTEAIESYILLTISGIGIVSMFIGHAFRFKFLRNANPANCTHGSKLENNLTKDQRFTYNIVSYALFEFTGISGFIIDALGGSKENSMPLFAFAILSFLISFPKEPNWED